ncbi:hypothetical protein MASR2M41_02800 [Flammeovirgaceae bacterium]
MLNRIDKSIKRQTSLFFEEVGVTLKVNTIIKQVFVYICLMGMLTLTSCKNENTLSAQEEALIKLTAAPWADVIVTVDGIDYSDLYKDLSIAFTESAYSTTGGAPVWAASGTWKFLNEEGTLLKFDDTREVEINSISDDILELSFQWDENTFEPGRVNSVKGKQKFKFKKKKK